MCRSLEPIPLTLLQLCSHYRELYDQAEARPEVALKLGTIPVTQMKTTELRLRQKNRENEVLKVPVIETS